MTRLGGLLYGALVYLFFLVTFLAAIAFVGNLPVPGLRTIDAPPLAGTWGNEGIAAWAIDLVLLGLFAVQHSVMARQGFKRWWTRIVPAALERSTFVLAASLVLALTIWQWRPIPGTVWNVSDPLAAGVLVAVFWLGWAVLLAATFLINHFELFGLQQVWNASRGRTPGEPRFRTPALYRWVRHPIYLGFILAFWAAPQMSVGHLLFAVATTGYILIGIWFEERDLVAQFGEEYRRYRRRVPMLVPWPGRSKVDPPPQPEAHRPGHVV